MTAECGEGGVSCPTFPESPQFTVTPAKARAKLFKHSIATSLVPACAGMTLYVERAVTSSSPTKREDHQLYLI